MRPVIVYRDDLDWRQESKSAEKYFPCFHSRLLVKPNDIVIGRYSALPFYKEQESDYKILNATMINSYREHEYIADLQEWYQDLQEYTPKTWFKLHEIPDEGPFVLKGSTNSKKFLWNTHMFAKNKREAIEIDSKLSNDSMIQYQDIVIRQYVPLVKYFEGLKGLPITKEFRFFCYKMKVLSSGYYWSSHIYDFEEEGIEVPKSSEVPELWLKKIMYKISQNTNFYVLDIAQTESGDWIVIELNDGQMSGLSENDPDVMYSNLKEALAKETDKEV